MRSAAGPALCLCAVLAAARAWGAEGPGLAELDPDQYPETPIAEVLAKSPCAAGSRGYEVKDVPFSTQLVYEETLRPAVPKHAAMIKVWARSIGAADQAKSFDRELKVLDGRTVWWMPLPASLLKDLKKDLREGDRAWFFLTFTGCIDGEPMLSIDDFSPPDYEDLEQEPSSYIT